MDEFKSFFKVVDGNEGERCHYRTRLDTYGCGCAHNCSYCYARSLLAFRGLWNPKAPAVVSVPKLVHRIDKELRRDEVVRLGGMTDCFQPIEDELRVAYMAIQMLNKRGIHYLIVTKSDLIASDKYLGILDKSLAHIQVSITSTRDDISQAIEPGAPLPARRIAAVEKLQSLGFDVQVRLSPIIPEYIDFDAINRINCDKALVEFLRVNTWVRKWMPGADFSDHSVTAGGYQHLPLDKKIRILDRVRGFKELSVCEDVPEHWEYWRDNVNANSEDCCNLRK